MFLYACSLLVPPSACHMSTVWPFFTYGVKRSPRPWTVSPTPRASWANMWWLPSSTVANALPLRPAEVRTRPSPSRNSRPKVPSVGSRRVSGPLVSSAVAPWVRVVAADCADAPGSSKSGPFRRRPA